MTWISQSKTLSSALLGVVGVAISVTACGPTQADPASSSIDDALVGLPDAKSLAGIDKLEQQGDSRSDQPRPDASAPGACRSVFGQQVAFGTNFTEFRNETYSGQANGEPGKLAPMVVISQSVGTYADDAAARKNLADLVPALNECAALADPVFNIQITKQDPSALELKSPAKYAVTYRVKSGKLVSVSVIGLTDADQTANKIIDKIVSRIA
ncbi:sensor domain-containing protein [Mycobacteroides sp. PCS013]|uniref:sensor domain-containing protein n=1 Tax=Mycobacteroides sp. PCS013 TaxID=3074106 RepID=UPI003C2C7A2E